MYVFFNDTATTEIYTLSLHDALPILRRPLGRPRRLQHQDERDLLRHGPVLRARDPERPRADRRPAGGHPAHEPHSGRSEEHTSELQSRQYLVCRLLLEKTKHYLFSYA